MGGGPSYLYREEEEESWKRHMLSYDGKVRLANFPSLSDGFKIGSKIYLAHQKISLGRLAYQHWFIMDENRRYFLEFGTTDTQNPYKEARVQINNLPHNDVHTNNSDFLTKESFERMKQMLGMKNFSICLRNSEHVANFIFKGRWSSNQIENGGLKLHFENYLKLPHNSYAKKRMLNGSPWFPSTIGPRSASENLQKIYSCIDKHYDLEEFHYFLDSEEEAYNILVVGPTGSGKSRLINIFFNGQICPSMPDHQSATKEICFLKGSGEILNLETGQVKVQKVVVCDTVGLCDTEWDNKEVLDLIKGRVSRNLKRIDAVFVVFKADRLLKEHTDSIKLLLDWLDYRKKDNHLNFLFVATFAENLKPDDKKRMKGQAEQMLGLKETTRNSQFAQNDREFDSLVYVGFPPEEDLNDTGKAKVKASWDKLQPLLRLDARGDALKEYHAIINEKRAWRQYIPVPSWETIKAKCVIL